MVDNTRGESISRVRPTSRVKAAMLVQRKTLPSTIESARIVDDGLSQHRCWGGTTRLQWPTKTNRLSAKISMAGRLALAGGQPLNSGINGIPISTESLNPKLDKVNFLLTCTLKLKYKKFGIRKLKFGRIQSSVLFCYFGAVFLFT